MKKYRIFFKCDKRADEPMTCIVVYYGFYRKMLLWDHWIGHMIEGLVMDGHLEGDKPTKFGDKYHSKYDTERVIETDDEYRRFRESLGITKDNAFVFSASGVHEHNRKLNTISEDA